MTYTLEQAEELVKLVERTGLVFCLTHNYTGHPLIRHARGLFRGGQMGKVRKVLVEYLQDFLMVPQEKQGNKQAVWRTDPTQAGLVGTMGDAGTHCENLLEYITGERISEVCADFTTFLPDRVLEEDANLLLRLSGGGRGIMTVSQVATGRGERAHHPHLRGKGRDPLGAGEPELHAASTITTAPGDRSAARTRNTSQISHVEHARPHRPPRGIPGGFCQHLLRVRRGHPPAHRREAHEDGRLQVPHRLRRPARHAVRDQGGGVGEERFHLGEGVAALGMPVNELRPPLPHPAPDFRRLEKVLRRSGIPDRVPFYEIFSNIEADVLEALGDPALPGPARRATDRSEALRALRTHIRHQYWLGYDYAAVREIHDGLSFSRRRRSRRR